MQIGILGAGNVGRTLGRAWASNGHTILFGVQDATDSHTLKLIAQIGANARAVSAREAAQVDVVALAVPWEAVPSVLESARDWSGKTLIDCTNPLQSNKLTAPASVESSGGEQVALWARGARGQVVQHSGL